jgi:two-component system chemotaxis sensor kinase CheA
VVGDRSLVADFVVQAHEHLDAVEPLLLEIEKSGRVTGAVANEIFREIHSIKGSAGFLGLHGIAELTHALESVLGRLRDGQLAWSAAFAHPLLRSVDQLRELLRGLPEDGGQLDRELLRSIEALGARGGDEPGLDPACAAQLRRGHSLAVVPLPGAGSERAEFLSRLVRFAEVVREGFPQSDCALVGSALEADLLAEALGLEPGALVPWRGAVQPSPDPEAPAAARTADSIRVRVDLLDRLMDLSGELALVRDELCRSADGPARELARELDRIASELQHSLTLSRLQPIRVLFERMPRLVRDVALRLGKEAELQLGGGEVEVDRSLLEALADPLTHLVRNALDHGIELPASRAAAGKPRAGQLALRAQALRGRVRIELQDDGAGIDLALVRTAAVRQGVVSIAEVAALDEPDVLELIFDAGVSTASGVSELSGRGVGLDVVRTNLERLGARIEVRSELGSGTRFRIDLPLTLALVPSLLVSAGAETLVIAQANVSRVARCAAPRCARDEGLEAIAGREYFRAAGQRLPFVRLARVLGGAASAPAGAGSGHVLVLRCGSGRFALGVDELADGGPVVVKPLPARLGECGWYSGCTLLADGRPALILDPAGIARSAGLRLDELPELPAATPLVPRLEEFVVFDACAGRRFAIPLAALRRVEPIAPERIERIAGREFLARDGDAVPLLQLDALLGLGPGAAGSEPRFALIARNDGPVVGIAAEQIVATRALDASAQPGPRDPGILGTAAVDQQIALLLEPRALFARAEQSL